MHACVCIPLPFECLLIQQVITINDISRTNTMTATTGEIIPTSSTIDNCAVVPTYMEHACTAATYILYGSYHVFSI